LLEVGWPLDGAMRGTQMAVHEPVHATFIPLSWLFV